MDIGVDNLTQDRWPKLYIGKPGENIFDIFASAPLHCSKLQKRMTSISHGFVGHRFTLPNADTLTEILTLYKKAFGFGNAAAKPTSIQEWARLFSSKHLFEP